MVGLASRLLDLLRPVHRTERLIGPRSEGTGEEPPPSDRAPRRRDTGSARLNEHLAAPDFFDTAKFPDATFTSTAVEATSPTTARITGDLTLRGIVRPLAIDVTFNQAGIHPVDQRYTVGFDGRALVKRSDFGITAFLPQLGDEVSLRIEGEFKAAQ